MLETKSHKTTPVLTTPQLRTLCERAKELKFSHGPSERFWREVDPAGHHLVTAWARHKPSRDFWQGVRHGWNFAHNNGKNIRATLLCQMKGRPTPSALICDFDLYDFRTLLRNQKVAA
jgi:hypothetical protein